MNRFRTGSLLLVLLTGMLSCQSPKTWQDAVTDALPVLGHRNWIVIADAAYPKQSAPGIQTVDTGAGQLDAVQFVLDAVESAPHVRPVIMMDEELAYLPAERAPGIEQYRQDIQFLLKDKTLKTLPHEAIIHKLDEASNLFNILILKTDMLLPYTSVFIELDCGYWDAESEAQLRNIMKEEK